MSCTRIAFALLVAGASVLGAAFAAERQEFRDWPAGTSPREVGKRVAENFVHPRGLPAHDGVAPPVPGRGRIVAPAPRRSRGLVGDLGHGDVHVRDDHRGEERMAGRQGLRPGRAQGLAGAREAHRREGNVREVCAGTPKGFSVEYYLYRPRNVGDLHGQAPILWSASALLR